MTRRQWSSGWIRWPVGLVLFWALVVCDGTIPPTEGPELTFQGTVMDPADAGVETTVSVAHTQPCGEVMVRADTGRSDTAGAYEIWHPSLDGLDGCFVVTADAADGLQAASDTLFNEDLHDHGDPLGSGVITVDLKLSEAHAR